MALRIKKVLPFVIGNTQKGFLKDRYIGENVGLVYDIMSTLKISGSKGLLLLLDFEKAFDSLEWSYIKNILQAYNVWKDFIPWFNLLYSGAISCAINNGHFTEFFKLERGCRQGDLSPYIFILAFEPLARMIALDSEIKGITLKGREFKLGQYADDIFLMIEPSEIAMKKSFKIFHEFYLTSGLKLNYDKTNNLSV